MTDGVGTRSFCRNREADKYKFGYCQQGLSVAFSKDSKYLVYGAPGAYDWKGTAKHFLVIMLNFTHTVTVKSVVLPRNLSFIMTSSPFHT